MNLHRLLHIGTNGAAVMMQSLTVLALSFVVLGRGGDALWGGFMYAYFAVELMAFIANWGFKEYLLLQASREPRHQSTFYWKTFFPRVGLAAIVGVVIIALPVFTWEIKCLVLLNGLMRMFIGSLEFFVVLNQRFQRALVAESTASVFFVGVVLFEPFDLVSTPVLIWIFSFYNTLRVLLLGVLMNDRLARGFAFSADTVGLRQAAPFFISSLAGFLQYRAVMYIAALLLSKEIFAHLQVSLSMVQASMIAAALLLSPFSAGIYRMDSGGLAKFKRTLLGWGLPLSLVKAGAIYTLMRFWLEMEVPGHIALVIYLYILGIYVFMLDVYEMNKNGRKKDVMAYSWLMVLLDFALSAVFIYWLGWTGAFYAMLFVQVQRVALFKWKPVLFNATST